MYQQGVFFNGGMNTDDEDRLIPNGDYRSAFFSRNYGVNNPSEGALQSMTGNLLQNNAALPSGLNIVIGACEDVEHKALILFVFNDLGEHSIWRYTVENSSYELILQDSILNFKKTNQIFHANVVNNLLYWTDNYFNSYTNNDFNPPRKINIQKAILYTQSGGTDPDGYSEITFNNLDWIKHPPLFSPTPVYYTDTTETSNNLKNKLFQFRYQYIYDDNEESAWSPISEMVLPSSGEYISQTVNIDPFVDNTINLDINTGSSIARLIRVAYRIGNTGEFFLYNEYNKSQLNWSDYSVETIAFKNETSGPAISNSERNYDLIPQVAKTIEYLPSSEFAIGNYIEGYDKLEIADKDISFSQNRYTIDSGKAAFTAPLADFINYYDVGNRYSVVSFNNTFGATFFKYRFQEGDVIIIQLKDLLTSYSNNTVSPDPILYFTVPYIDPVLYPTDQDKVKQLSVKFIEYLDSNGITGQLIPPGSLTISGISLTWWTVKILNKTWFNTTIFQSQLAPTNENTYYFPITILRNNYVERTFKTGATHEFAIQYYDRANRDGTVLTVPAGEVYVPFNTDLTDIELNDPSSNIKRHPYATQITMSIGNNFQPPIWATHYQVLYKPSTNISNFQQRSVKAIIYNPDSTISLVLDNYYLPNYQGASINQTPSKGDLVRLVRQRALFEREKNILAILGSDDTTYNVGSVVPVTNYDIGYGTSFFEIYDQSSYVSGFTFTPSTTGVHTINFEHSYSADWAGSTSVDVFSVQVNLRNTTTGIDTQLTVSNSFFYEKNKILKITTQDDVNLTVGQNYIVKLLFQVTASATLTDFSYRAVLGKINFSLGLIDYDPYSYFPKYVTNDINNNFELNVMSYNPGAGTSGADIITVNYFDASILGEYLTFTGTSQYRTIASGGFQIEIYTPKKQSENDPWYEVGIEWEIENPHTAGRVHTGNINQVLGSLNALVYLNCGDVYIRQRIMSTGYNYEGDSNANNIYDANDVTAAWFCEDPHYSDFYVSNWNNKGRLALYSPFAKQQHLKASIYHTNALIDNTQINGLSRIEFFNNVALKDEHGSINRLMQIGDTLKAFQDKKITSVYIQKAFALNGDGTNNVILSDKTFAGVRPHDDDYGCIHPGSVSKAENNIFFYDFYNAAVIQATQGGLINICEGERKFSVGIRNFTNNIRSYEESGYPSNVVSHINRSNGEYILYAGTNIDEITDSTTFVNFSLQTPQTVQITGNQTSIFTAGVTFTISGATNPANDGTFTVTSSSYNAGVNRTDILVSPGFVATEKPCPGTLVILPEIDISTEGIVYSFNRQRWTSYTSHAVIFASQFGNRAYTTGGFTATHLGELFEEDKGDELIFFNYVVNQNVRFLFNANPTIVKRFLTFMTQSNMPFEVQAIIPPTNQYPGGMSTNMLVDNFRNQESYYVSKYFRDMSDPNPFLPSALKRLNGRELRGYVLDHTLTYSPTGNKKMILFSTNVNFVPSEPLMQ